jgi:hypothetical protein
MALMRRLVAAWALVAAGAASAGAQSIAVDAEQTAGASTGHVAAAATQVHLFGDVGSGVRFLTEASWATRTETTSDVFGAAYPYDNRVRVIETYAERMFQPGGRMLAVRVGRYRTPFGMSSASDHAYIGFLRAPLIRYDGYYALSNNFLEHGADVVFGTPRLLVEGSLGVPADVGTAGRRRGADAVVRAQSTVGSAIVGVSVISTHPYQSPLFAQGRARFAGVDARWMRAGVQARGEWIIGRPFDGTTTTGGYVDLIVHRPRMGPLTAVARAERLSYQTIAPFELYGHRYTAGARLRVFDRWTVEVEVVRQNAGLPEHRPTALDVAVTYAVRRRLSR